MTTTVTSEKFVKASPAQVYYALTHSISLHEWLCDFATVTPRPGGRMYLWWHGDFYSAGEYLALEENKSVKFKWFARSEPAASEVLVTLIPRDDGTLVSFNHMVPDGEEWKKRADGFKAEWDSTLPNLASVLETGLDRRTFDRPMLGIFIGDFNPEIAKNLGIPVSQGLRLDEVRQGMGASAAGLCKDDVIVEMNGKPITTDYGSLVVALAGKKGGDQVQVVFYRGSQKKTVTMELSKRPVPDVPWNPLELSKKVRTLYDDALVRLEDCFKEVSESDADQEPAPGEWSAKQTLAHLIHNERERLIFLDDSVAGYERLADDFGGNLPAHVKATVKSYGTTLDLLDEMKHLTTEIVAYLSLLPESFLERKASYFSLAAGFLELESHIISHTEQIRSALAAAKK